MSTILDAYSNVKGIQYMRNMPGSIGIIMKVVVLTLYCMKPFPAIKIMPFNTHNFELKKIVYDILLTNNYLMLTLYNP